MGNPFFNVSIFKGDLLAVLDIDTLLRRLTFKSATAEVEPNTCAVAILQLIAVDGRVDPAVILRTNTGRLATVIGHEVGMEGRNIHLVGILLSRILADEPAPSDYLMTNILYKSGQPY